MSNSSQYSNTSAVIAPFIAKGFIHLLIVYASKTKYRSVYFSHLLIRARAPISATPNFLSPIRLLQALSSKQTN